jgi:hypothetical protein
LLAAQQTITDAQQQTAQPPAFSAPVTKLVQPILIATSNGTKVELSVMDSLSAANTILGQPVRLVVTRDAVDNAGTIIRAGTPVNGIVTRVRYGSFRSNRGDQLDVRLTGLAPGKLIRLQLATISSPEPTYPDEPMPAYPGYPRSNGPSLRAVTIGTVILIALACAALAAGDR